jgi:hypothetical protein
MTHENYYSQVQCDLDEGYSVKLFAPDGFKMKVSFSWMDDTGEPYYVAVGIEGSEFAHISEDFDINSLENFIVDGGFELYENN